MGLVARRGRGEGARRAGRRAPAAAAARAREARARRRRARGRRPARSSVEEIEARAAHSAEWRAYALADALVAGDAREATLRLPAPARAGRAPGRADLPDGPAAARGARDRAAPARRASRWPRSSAGCACRARAAERFVADVARTDPERLRAALGALADLELDSRGGAPLARAPLAAGRRCDEDTLALRAIEAITELGAERVERGSGGCAGAACARRGTSCGRRCCGAARRA